MKIDIYRIPVEKNGVSEEFVVTLKTPVVPRVGDELEISFQDNEGKSLHGIGPIRIFHLTVQRVVHTFGSHHRLQRIACLASGHPPYST